MDTSFPEMKKKLGFGFMRLPMNRGGIDSDTVCAMVDEFLAAGFNYFDTAHGYHSGRSETAIRDCLTSRYPRDSYILADKLTDYCFSRESDIRPLFMRQLAACGVDYFDFYLMHSQGAELFDYFKKRRAYETAIALKEEGRIRHFGISFHDRASVLRSILLEYPQIEVVQIQLNYADYDDPAVESRKVYEVCAEFHKPVIVMEPVKGGSLADLPESAESVFSALHGGSPASYAIRFAAGFEGVVMVLSGMSTIGQLRDNMSFMTDLAPLCEKEQAAIEKVCGILRAERLIQCTACRYCTDACPKRIDIPSLFACMNAHTRHGDWNQGYYYDVITERGGKASDCIKCGKCEHTCPQHLEIRKLLKNVAKMFE